MMRRASILLAVVVAGCAGGDLSRADTDAALGAEEGSGTTGSGPVTTGLTGISGGASTQDPASTSAQPSPSGEATDTGADDDTTTGADASSGDLAESSAGGESSGGDETGESSTTETGADVDLSGWTVHQANSSRQFTLPAGTVVPPGTIIVLGRDATRGAFEQHWGALDADVVYFDTGDTLPAINGGETFTLRDPGRAAVDGPTPALQGGDGVRRLDLSTPGMWTSESEADADPGVGHPDPGQTGVFVTEACDASGSGAYRYEYVELQAW